MRRAILYLLSLSAPHAFAGDLPVRFVDRTAETGVGFRHIKSATPSKYLIETMGGGAALLDYDRDGWLDVYLVNGAKLEEGQRDDLPPSKVDPAYWNRLYRNQGDGSFRDVTALAGLEGEGYGMGAAAGDFDNDGDPDLAVTTFGGVYLYRNQGDGSFRDVTAEAGLQTDGWTTSAGFLDYDNDGRLDLFVARYLDWNLTEGAKHCGPRTPGGRSYCHPNEFKPMASYLFHNEGDGTFADVSSESGIEAHLGKSLGIAFEDFDRDGWTDIYVTNDSHPQFLFRNNGDGTFEEQALPAGVAYAENGQTFAGMGAEFADVDGDLWPDILATALPHERFPFFANRADGTFQYSSFTSRLGEITSLLSGWGVRVFDFDNDGFRDVFLANSHVMDNIEVLEPGLTYEQPPRLLTYRDGRFFDISARSGEIFGRSWAARGAAFGDLDNDGDVDAVVTTLDGPAHVLFNDGGNRNRWVGLLLTGVKSNREGLGAVVTLTTKDGIKFRQMATRTAGYLSSHDRKLFFGLGLDGEIAEVVIEWPSGIVQTIETLPVNRVNEIVER